MRYIRRLSRSLRAVLALRVPPLVRWLPTAIPLLFRHYPCAPQRTDALLVCLPGIEDLASDYETHGFIDAIRQSGFGMDVVTVDAHYGYYARRTLLARLREDVIGPARAAGYEKVWLLGISLGGLGALLYAQSHPEDVSGLVLLAPFLGTTGVVDEVRRGGGLAHWVPGHAGPPDFDQSLWQWLAGYLRHPERMPALHLAFGARDRFAAAHRLLAANLPAQHVHILPGRHNWRTWRRLWHRLLATGLFRHVRSEALQDEVSPSGPN